MTQKHIFIVDDEVLLIRAIEVALELNGFKVSTAINGREAIEKINEIYNSSEKIDMLITDIQMPEMDGIEMIDALSKDNKKIPVMAITGFGTKEMVIELLRMGVKDYIDKPFKPEELVARIEKFLKKQEQIEVVDTKPHSAAQPNYFLNTNGNDAKLEINKNVPMDQENIRKMLLELLALNKANLCLDLKNISEIDIAFVNGLVGLHHSHQEKFKSGVLELINVDKDLMVIFKSVELDVLYKISHN